MTCAVTCTVACAGGQHLTSHLQLNGGRTALPCLPLMQEGRPHRPVAAVSLLCGKSLQSGMSLRCV